MKKNILLILFCLFILKISNAQYQGNVYQAADSAIINSYGINLPYPWMGGMNCIEITKGDLNNDGKSDIVVYDYINNKIFPFINKGIAGTVNYQYDEKYAKNFPTVNYYLILKDYNCDGIPDLFTKGMAGINVSKGFYINNQLHFSFYKELYYPGTFGPINAYVQPSDIPSIIDIDKDGDLDFLAFDVLGNYISFYKNLRVENHLDCDSIVITDATDCWGKTVQNSYTRAYQLNVTCKGFAPNGFIAPDLVDETDLLPGMNPMNFNYQKNTKTTRHTGNCLLHFDENGDGLYDLLVGSIGTPDVQLLRNGGTTSSALITAQDTVWNTPQNKKIYCPNFIAIGGEDIDNDGKEDLQFAPHIERNSNNQFYTNDKLYYYRNTSNTAVPNYNLQSDSLLFDGTLDFGAYSYPTFFDYNKDGLKDLFVGSAGTMDTSNFQLKSKIAYYKNVSTKNKIKFELVTKDFLNIGSKNYQGIYPTFADITGDGIADLIMGNNQGQIVVYKNTSASDANIPNFQWLTDSFKNIKIVGNYSAPCMFDANFDGRLDLIIGAQNGHLIYYEDSSTVAGVSKFYNKTGTLGQLTVGGHNYFYGYAAPSIAVVDSFKRQQLLIGTGDGTIERYDSLEANIYGPYIRLDSFYSHIQTLERAVPAVADLDNDGDYEMIVGNKLGGLQFYQQVKLMGSPDTINIPDSTLAIKNLNLDKNSFTIYPNPTSEKITFENNYNLSNINLQIINTTGQLVFEKINLNGKSFEINISSLQNGLYYFKIYNTKYFKTGSILKQ